jgi:DNA-binding response OmpR family regulator
MGGHDVVRTLRADDRTRGCYLIVSSVLDAQDRANAGADANLAKPFRRDALAAAIRPALNRAG